MASHTLDRQPEERLFTEIADLRRQLSELRTLQQQASQALPVRGYPGVGVSYDTTLTIAANSQQVFNLGVRTSSFGPTVWEPALAIHVDVDDADHLWPTSKTLTAAQKKLFCSVVRNWEHGQVPQDPENRGSWDIQLWNLDSVSHVYYIHVKLFAPLALDPLTLM